jgi:hypothetical protein
MICEVGRSGVGIVELLGVPADRIILVEVGRVAAVVLPLLPRMLATIGSSASRLRSTLHNINMRP